MAPGKPLCERVLLVDDDADTLDTLSDVLLFEGVGEVRVAGSLREAEQILASGWTPSAIVLDLLLNGDRGESLLGTLQGNPLLSRVPVIAVSGDALALKGVSGRVAHTLLKPASPDAVMRALGDVCSA